MANKNWQSTAPMRAGLVVVCPKCFAYVMNAKAHKKWHEKQPRPVSQTKGRT